MSSSRYFLSESRSDECSRSPGVEVTRNGSDHLHVARNFVLLLVGPILGGGVNVFIFQPRALEAFVLDVVYVVTGIPDREDRLTADADRRGDGPGSVDIDGHLRLGQVLRPSVQPTGSPARCSQCRPLVAGIVRRPTAFSEPPIDEGTPNGV